MKTKIKVASIVLALAASVIVAYFAGCGTSQRAMRLKAGKFSEQQEYYAVTDSEAPHGDPATPRPIDGLRKSDIPKLSEAQNSKCFLLN